MATRSPEEIQHSIERNRRELAGSVEELRIKVKVLTDWRRQINEHRTAAIAGAAVLGFVVGGGLRRLPPPPLAALSQVASGTPPMPSRPGPTWVPITGPTSDTNSGGSRPIMARAASISCCGLLRRLDVLDDPGVGAVGVQLLARTRAGAAAPWPRCARARSA